MQENTAKVLQIQENRLHEQLDLCRTVIGKSRQIVETFLRMNGIRTLEEIDEAVKDQYIIYIDSMTNITDGQRRYNQTLLDRICLDYRITRHTILATYVGTVINGRAIKNRVLLFLLEHGVEDCKEIDYELRKKYETSLVKRGCTKLNEYVKAMDLLKLATIQKDNDEHPLKARTWQYGHKKFFLLYHPNYALAKTFYYVRDKAELMFDFTLVGSEIVKKQIFQMLNWVLEEKRDWHDRRERFLIPLKKFYMYCMETGVQDIELLTKEQVEAFRLSMEGKVGTKSDIYMQIVYNVTKYLFVTAKQTNWNANIWYLERFSFKNGRDNPAREIEKIYFGQIKDEDNRAILKQYMKYQIGVAQRISLQTIRCQYYGICSFMEYCDTEGWKLTEINNEMMERYIYTIDVETVQPETYNRKVIAVAKLFGYMKNRHWIKKEPLAFEYYLKTVYVKHNNRTVSVENQVEVLTALKKLPLHLRLMFLNLWCEGVRACEVCVIKAGMYTWDGQDAWLKLYQNKMKKEKCIPIPTELYKLMEKYIEENRINPNDYVFKNRKGGAYDVGTFAYQMKKELKKAGITSYTFRAHDFRHTIGTRLNKEYGVSIETIREFLGHNSSDMTKQYLDFVPEMLDAENQKYFANKENVLAERLKEKNDREDLFKRA